MKYITKKVIALIITLLIVSFLAFLAFQIIPGDPTTRILGSEATPEMVAALREQLGLNRPMLLRYLDWLGNFVRGNYGISYTYKVSVNSLLADKLPITIILTALSFIITGIVAIPLGILAGSVKNKIIDKIVIIIDQIVMSIPAFFIGMIVCFLFGIMFRFFIPGQFVALQDDWRACIAYLVFPAVSIAIPRIAMTVKMLRSSILNQLGQDYVRTARSRGNNRRQYLFRHVIRNAMIPVITFLAVSLAEIMTGTIIIEQVFTIPGIGRLLISSIGTRDFPVVQAIVVLIAAWIVIVNFAADIVNQVVDPRLRNR